MLTSKIVLGSTCPNFLTSSADTQINPSPGCSTCLCVLEYDANTDTVNQLGNFPDIYNFFDSFTTGME